MFIFFEAGSVWCRLARGGAARRASWRVGDINWCLIHLLTALCRRSCFTISG